MGKNNMPIWEIKLDDEGFLERYSDIYLSSKLNIVSSVKNNFIQNVRIHCRVIVMNTKYYINRYRKIIRTNNR